MLSHQLIHKIKGEANPWTCFVISIRYVPTLLWGKSGHVQTILYGKMGRVNSPFPLGDRHSIIMSDGATMTFDIFKPLSETGDFFVKYYVNYQIINKLIGDQCRFRQELHFNGVSRDCKQQRECVHQNLHWLCSEAGIHIGCSESPWRRQEHNLDFSSTLHLRYLFRRLLIIKY